MGRTTGYDARALVRDARDLFWRKGFDAVSVSEMEQSTGVGRSSIYHAYGSMRGLFDAAVEDYLDAIVRPRLAPLSAAEVAPTAITDYLRGLAEAIATLDAIDGAPHGCLLLTSAAAPIGTDDAVHAVIERYHLELSTALGRGVAARLPQADAATQERITRLCVAACVAAQSLARIDAKAACATLDAARESLDEPVGSA